METLWLILIGIAFVVSMLAGVRVAFGLGSLAIVVGYVTWGSSFSYIALQRSYSLMSIYIFVAVPLFVFMGALLSQTGIAEKLYNALYHSLGRVKGGLAIGTLVICTIMAAMTGIVGASTVTMGLIALPSMLKRGYDKHIAIGSIAAGGSLGVLIPPSVHMIIIGGVSQLSIAKMFAAGIIPGLTLSAMFALYIIIRCYFQPNLAPAIPKNELKKKEQEIAFVLKDSIPVLILIFATLGTIFLGIATPTEAAGLGVLGTILITIAYGRLKLKPLKEACHKTLITTCMIFWIMLGAQVLSSVLAIMGVLSGIEQILLNLSENRWIVLIAIQLLLLPIGMFMDQTAIILLFGPTFFTVIRALGFDPLWFSILFLINLEFSYLTPPFGYTLFYLKGISPQGITTNDIYKSIIPFVFLGVLGIAIFMMVPKLITFLPTLLLGK